jgi:exodeoxyribonuclease VII small subunit
MAENTQVDVKKLSFERAIEELESIVKRLEDGKVPLEESVAIYERGEALKRRCEELLRQAEARVDKITTDASGQVTGTEPLVVQYRSHGNNREHWANPAPSRAKIALCAIRGLL